MSEPASGPRFTFAEDNPEEIVRLLVGGEKMVAVRGHGLPFPVSLVPGRAPDGRLACKLLLVGGNVTEVTATSLRALPLGEIVDELSRQYAPSAREGLAPLWFRPTRLGPHGIPRERLAQVAQLYRRALDEQRGAPVRWLCEHITGPNGKPTPEPTVRRWLQRCRDLGLLGPSIPGKAGEQPRSGPRRRRR
jgi:hypothetical protein